MKATEARKLTDESLERIMREDVVSGMLDDALEKIEKCAGQGLSRTTYHFGWWLWPFSRYFPNFVEQGVFIEALRQMGYKADYETRGISEGSNHNIVEIRW